MSDAILTPRMKVNVALTTLLTIAREVEERNPVQSARMDAAEARRILVELFDDAKIILDYVDTQEANMREMRNERLRAEEEITALQQRLYAGTRAAERLLTTVSAVLDQATEAFNDARKLPTTLAGEFPRPMGVVEADAQRTRAVR